MYNQVKSTDGELQTMKRLSRVNYGGLSTTWTRPFQVTKPPIKIAIINQSTKGCWKQPGLQKFITCPLNFEPNPFWVFKKHVSFPNVAKIMHSICRYLNLLELFLRVKIQIWNFLIEEKVPLEAVTLCFKFKAWFKAIELQLTSTQDEKIWPYDPNYNIIFILLWC